MSGYLFLGRRKWMGSLLLFAAVAAGCSSEQDPRGQRVEISGTVTLDGVPLSAGTIRLISDQGTGSLKAKAVISEGKFMFSKESGPLNGKARVEIYPPIMELEQYDFARKGQDSGFVPIPIPQHYNVKSVLTAVIEPAGSEQSLTFELKSH